MGTSVTTHLSLIKPDLSESIKEDLPTFDGWASQNADNCDIIDGLFRRETTSYTVNWTGSGSNPVLGAGGFTEGKYIRLWPRMVIVNFRIFTGGAGFTVGTGLFRINLPVAIDPIFASTFFAETAPIGKAIFYDANSALNSSVFLIQYLSSASLAFFRPPSGGAWQDSTPVAIEQNDRISGYMMFPTSDA